MDQNNIPGRGQATASMVLGIVSCSLDFLFFLIFRILYTGYFFYVLAGILGVIGIFLAHASKQHGYTGASCTAGKTMSWISAVIGAIFVGIIVSLFIRIRT